MPSYFCLNSQLLILIRQNWLTGISMVVGSYLVLVVPLLIVMFCVYNAERKRIAQQEVSIIPSTHHIQWRIQDFADVGAPILLGRQQDFAKFPPKLHEIERIWTRGGACPRFYFVDPPLTYSLI